MTYSSLSFRVTGIAPLIMRAVALADPLHPLIHKLNDIAKEKLKTDTDYEKMAEIDWYGSLWVEDGRLAILGEAIEAVIVRAAQTPKTGRADLAGLICPEKRKADLQRLDMP